MSLIKKNTLSTTARVALAFVWAYAATVDGTKRKIDIRLAEAKLSGLTVAAYAFGYGHTEYHVQLTVHEVMRDHPMPAWQATGVNHTRDEWEVLALAAVQEALDSIATREIK